MAALLDVVLAVVRQLPGCSGATSEQAADDGLFSIDIAVQLLDGSRLAVEVDGPHHFLSSPPCRLNGATLLRNRLLEARVPVVIGWRPHAKQGQQAARDYLLSLGVGLWSKGEIIEVISMPSLKYPSPGEGTTAVPQHALSAVAAALAPLAARPGSTGSELLGAPCGPDAEVQQLGVRFFVSCFMPSPASASYGLLWRTATGGSLLVVSLAQLQRVKQIV
jgi:hypothetical protein